MRDSGKTTYSIDELIEAIRGNRNIAEIQKIIAGVEDINQPYKNQYTALHIAAIFNKLKIVKKLLAHDANANLVDSDGMTALYWAANNNNIEMVRVLIVYGANVNKADKNGSTALCWAAKKNNIEMVRELIVYGAKVNKADIDGSTALMNAAMWCHNQEMVRDLIAHGADETLLTKEQQARYAEVIAEGILIRKNTKNSACALADIGQELQRVSIIQKHPCREPDESQQDENKLPEFTEPILAQIAAYATDIQRPNRLTQDQIKKCAEVGTESLAKTDITQFNETDKKFVARNPGNTINNILNGSQNPTNGQVLGG